MRIITEKEFLKIKDTAREQGLVRGYELGFKMGQVEKLNRSLILNSKVVDEIDNILRRNYE